MTCFHICRWKNAARCHLIGICFHFQFLLQFQYFLSSFFLQTIHFYPPFLHKKKSVPVSNMSKKLFSKDYASCSLCREEKNEKSWIYVFYGIIPSQEIFILDSSIVEDHEYISKGKRNHDQSNSHLAFWVFKMTV